MRCFIASIVFFVIFDCVDKRSPNRTSTVLSTAIV